MGTAWMLLKYGFLGPISSPSGNEVKSWREEPESAFLVGATGDCSPTEIWDLTLGFVERWSTDGSLQPLAFLFGVPWGRVYKWRALIPLLPFLWRGWGSTRHGDGAFSPHRKGLERKKIQRPYSEDGAEDPVSAFSTPIPTCKAGRLQHSGTIWGKRIKNLTCNPPDLFKAVFSTCWNSFRFKSLEAWIMNEGGWANSLWMQAGGRNHYHSPYADFKWHFQVHFNMSSFSLRLLQNALLECGTWINHTTREC